MADSKHSIHALVRLLKSPTDPPSISGPSKLETACLAWSDSTFVAANKGEVIGEWILTLLGQARKTRRQSIPSSTSDPIADSRYWTLLGSVLTSPLPATARPMKTWLVPLLSRFQLDGVVIELLACQSSLVLAPARSALAILWPLGEKKISADSLGECLCAVFGACTQWERVNDDLAWICSIVVDAYTNALANAGNKKKFYASFLSTHLSAWLSIVRTAPSLVSTSPTRQLQDSIYAAGVDTLFSLDALKQPLDTLFNALSSSQSPSSCLSLLPKLFASFLNVVHRHRSALFVAATSAASGKEDVRKVGMEFVRGCWTLIQGPESLQEGFNEEKWRSIVGIFRIVEKERLFVPNFISGSHIATDDGSGGELVLREARDKAIEMLEKAGTLSKDYQEKRAIGSLQLLDILVQIEYDFIGPALERVLSALINIPLSLTHLAITPFSDFLVRVLEYHTKTRTVHTYTFALLRAVVAGSVSFPWISTASTTPAFPLAHHLPVLARALRTSLTPTQTTLLANTALQAVESAWEVFKGIDQGKRVSKKRKITEGSEECELETGIVSAQARAFSFTSRIAATILSNFPSNAYTEDGEDSLKSCWEAAGKLGWSIFWDYLREGAEKAGRHQAQGSHGKKRKRADKTDSLSRHHPPIIASAALRFLYDIRARVYSTLGNCDRLKEADVETLLNVVQDEASEPELVLEIIRTLFWHLWYTQSCEPGKRMEAQPIFVVTLDVLIARISLKSKWSGMLTDLTHDNLGLAILYVLTDRWIDVLDALASPEIMGRLISLLLGVPLDLPEEDVPRNPSANHLEGNHPVITSRAILLKLFRNAHFWELHNIRAVFLSSVLSLTAPLSFPAARAKSPLLTAAPQTELTIACNVYKLLGYIPLEYFTRPARSELVRRAMVGDIQICAVLTGAGEQRSDAKKLDIVSGGAGLPKKPHIKEVNGVPAEDMANWSRRLTFVRAFLQRMQSLNHTTSSAIVDQLLSSSSIFCTSKPLTDVTLDLIQSSILNLLRSREPEAATSISSILSTFIAARPFSEPKSQETWRHTIVQSSILKLIEWLTSDFDPASLPDRVRRSLNTLRDSLESVLSPHILGSVGRDFTELPHFLSCERISAWSRILSLTRWLGIHSQVASNSFGQRLATSMIRSRISEKYTGLDPETSSSVLRLLFEELRCMPGVSHRAHLDIVVGFFVVNGGCWVSDQTEFIDTYVTQAAKNLSVEDFSYLLDIMAEGIGGSGLGVRRGERLIRLGQVILHNAPQGTLKATQNFVTHCFNSFADRGEIYGSCSSLKVQYLEFTVRHCSDRPMAIRPVDLGSIWSFLGRILSGTSGHDATTVLPIFYHIVTTVGVLIRLRRDLVVHTLPHLSLVLCQLMMLTRKIRPQLGAKQSKIVTDTFPSWLSASQPLSTDEGRALGRLLTSLTTKTVPRTHLYGRSWTSTEQKAESLAKPFAKHATYVLVAYVDAFNDPLCVIDADMRRELEPGLFALCEIVGEHSRDALMVSTLDSGGKTIMKSLWKDYEKQRYVGGG